MTASVTAPFALNYLRSPQTIRERCNRIFSEIEANNSSYFLYRSDKLEQTADLVVQEIRSRYPDLKIPYHSRWRHFEAGRASRSDILNSRCADMTLADRARTMFELTITSVLLDAGAGDTWRYKTPATSEIFSRSEGLAIASFDLFISGAFSSDSHKPLQADATGLKNFNRAVLEHGFQVSSSNPLLGVDGRVELMNNLGSVVNDRIDVFTPEHRRLGGLFDAVAATANEIEIRASELLRLILDVFGPIWPGRESIKGIGLGDVWRHSKAGGSDESAGLVPFHKLSQWLTYSLIEPLEKAGYVLTDLDQLTALAEYRNGGLLIDSGLLEVRSEEHLLETYSPGDEFIVEWRAATIVLVDRLAEVVRRKLNLTAEDFPLVKVLEGGTWWVGRRLAAEKRPGGGPPITIKSDGTVF